MLALSGSNTGRSTLCLDLLLASMADYDGQDVEHMEEEQPQQRLRSTVVSEKRKGRGFRADEREEEGNTRYESLEPTGGTGPAKSGEYELGGASDGLLHLPDSRLQSVG